MEGQAMISQEEFLEQLKIAAEIVASWPAWKQNILENSAKPFVDKPRPPVISAEDGW